MTASTACVATTTLIRAGGDLLAALTARCLTSALAAAVALAPRAVATLRG